jgi:type IV pilus assembly protein PilZ
MPGSEPPQTDHRAADRADVSWDVDCETEDTFLFASITNISAMGIFVRTNDPMPIGTVMTLRFTPRAPDTPFTMQGRVQWLNRISAFGENLNPGMGIMFVNLHLDERERLVSAIRTIAYLRSDPTVVN